MPKVRWGVSSGAVDDYDRDSQYKPYTGPTPPNAVYQWTVKVLKHAAGTRDKNPQLRIGLELKPRRGRDEDRYKGYFVFLFRAITDRNQFTWVPFLDAIGVSGDEFERGTITDEDGNIKKIGRWRNDGKAVILGQLVDDEDARGDFIKGVKWMGPLDSTPDDDEYDDEDVYDDDVDIEEDDEPEPPRRKSRPRASTRAPASRSRRRSREDEYDAEDDPF